MYQSQRSKYDVWEEQEFIQNTHCTIVKTVEEIYWYRNSLIQITNARSFMSPVHIRKSSDDQQSHKIIWEDKRRKKQDFQKQSNPQASTF